MHDDGEELAGLAVGGEHGVRLAAVEIDAVALVQDFLLAVQEDAQGTGEDQDEFLAVVLGILKRFVLAGGRSRDDEGFAGAVLHADRLVQIGKLGAADEGEALAAARDGIQGQVRSFAANDGGDVQSEVSCQIVVERERRLLGPAFEQGVFLRRDTEEFCHLFNGEVFLSPELTDSHGDLFFVFHVLRSLFGFGIRIAQEKTGIRIRVETRPDHPYLPCAKGFNGRSY